MKIDPAGRYRGNQGASSLLGSGAIVVGLSAILIVGAIAWSLWAEIDQITRAPGRIIPIGRVQILQSTDGGQIRQILVQEGDKVRAGQLLVTLDTAKVGAGVAETRTKVAALQTTLARVEAELFDRPLTFPAGTRGYPDFVENQRRLYAKRRSALAGEVAAINKQGQLAREELMLNEPLVKSGDVSRSEILRMARAVADLDSQAIIRRDRYLQDLQAEYTRTQEELATAQQQLAQRNSILSDTELRSPVDGIVKNVRLTTIGGVLRPGDEVLQIVPTGENLIVEAKIVPADIAFIRVGQSASIKFDAYDSSIYGAGAGRVTFVSPDTISEPRQTGGDATYYRVNLAADTRQMRSPTAQQLIEIQPGMTVNVEIKTGQTTVFRYLTKPLTKTLSQSLGER